MFMRSVVADHSTGGMDRRSTPDMETSHGCQEEDRQEGDEEEDRQKGEKEVVGLVVPTRKPAHCAGFLVSSPMRFVPYAAFASAPSRVSSVSSAHMYAVSRGVCSRSVPREMTMPTGSSSWKR